jgi:hypothetical protein
MPIVPEHLHGNSHGITLRCNEMTHMVQTVQYVRIYTNIYIWQFMYIYIYICEYTRKSIHVSHQMSVCLSVSPILHLYTLRRLRVCTRNCIYTKCSSLSYNSVRIIDFFVFRKWDSKCKKESSDVLSRFVQTVYRRKKRSYWWAIYGEELLLAHFSKESQGA